MKNLTAIVTALHLMTMGCERQNEEAIELNDTPILVYPINLNPAAKCKWDISLNPTIKCELDYTKRE